MSNINKNVVFITTAISVTVLGITALAFLAKNVHQKNCKNHQVCLNCNDSNSE
ncbi:MAG: hypothetical protein MR210_02490 [Erysipelotrichaceae bacterium]|nr:hypothetical protein [Erysipelotrichaceae bacterium]MDY5252772.1 hypothetical protein [Erysipelotrichaceae bacterium]